MSDDTTEDDSTDTLTLTARGPAERHQSREDDAFDAATITEHVDVNVTLKADARMLAGELGHIHKQGAVLNPGDVADVVCGRLGDSYNSAGKWDLELSARVDDWTAVAVRAAKDRLSPQASDSRIITAACYILDSWHDHAIDDRPLLAMLDLVTQYDVDDYGREGVLNALRGDRMPAGEEMVADV